MKRVYLSCAFGSTPKTVYKRIEHTFKMPLPPEKKEGPEAETEEAAQSDLKIVSSGARLRVSVLVALASALLILTAVLVLEPGKKGDGNSRAQYLAKATGSLNLSQAAAALPGVNITLSQAYADAEKVRATAELVLTEPGEAHYFWYDGKSLPAQFPEVNAQNGETVYYINCALSWEEGETQMMSDLASPQTTDNGELSVMMAGAWDTEEERREVICRAVSVRANADGTYREADVSYAEIPVVFELAKRQ